MKLRPGSTADLDALQALEGRCFGADAWTRAQLQAQLRRADGVFLLGTGDQDRPIGFALGWVVGDLGELLRMAVAPELRRAGHGGRLLDGFIQACRDRGADELWLELREDNDPARRLYERRGFRTTGRRADYYTDGTAAILMGWRAPKPPRGRARA